MSDQITMREISVRVASSPHITVEEWDRFRAHVGSHPLDELIRPVVESLISANLATFTSCQGGPGHSFSSPVVRLCEPGKISSGKDLEQLRRRAVRVLLEDGFSGFNSQVVHMHNTSKDHAPFVEIEFWTQECLNPGSKGGGSHG